MYKLSVIIPLYNTEKYIYKCIESCLNQSQSHDDYEIIVVNDGSTDDSYNIAKSFEKGDFNVQVLSQENNKQGAARNFGLKKARGEYIWFVDSDDWIEQNAIENLLSIVKKTPVDIVRFNAVDYTGSSSKLRPCKHIPNIIYNRQKILSENKFSVCFPFHIFNREFLLKNNLFFLEGVFFEDNELMIKILDKVNSFLYIDKSFYNVLNRSESTTRTLNYDRFLDISIVINSQIEYLMQGGYKDGQKNVLLLQLCQNMNSMLIKTSKSKEVFEKAIRALKIQKNLPLLIKESGSLFHRIQFFCIRYPKLLRKLLLYYYGFKGII